MADPYTDVTVASYNSSPPSDDGSQTEANRVKYSTIKTKLSDPLNTAIAAINTNVGAAVDKLAGGVSEQAMDFTVTASEQGKVVVATSTGTLTLDSTLGAPYMTHLYNRSGGTVTVTPSSGTIDNETSITFPDNTGATFFFDGTDWHTAGRGLTEGDKTKSYVIPLPANFINGLTISNNSSDSAHDIDIAAGVCRDSADALNIELTSGITKRIDAGSWAAGTGNGGLPAAVSLSADTWYNVFLIEEDGSGTVDAGFDTSATAANLLSDSGYANYRLLGSVLTNSSSDIIQFTQLGDYFAWDDTQDDFTTTNMSTGKSNITISAPTGRNVLAQVRVELSGSSSLGMYLFSGVATDNAPSASGSSNDRDLYIDGSITNRASAEFTRLTGTSSDLAVRSSGANLAGAIRCIGWYEPSLR